MSFSPRWYLSDVLDRGTGRKVEGPKGIVSTGRSKLELPEELIRLAQDEYDIQHPGQPYERMQERGGLGVVEMICLLADALERERSRLEYERFAAEHQMKPPRIAMDGDGFWWRVFDDGTWSMCPTNSDNSPVSQPVTYYVPAGALSGVLARLEELKKAFPIDELNHVWRVLSDSRRTHQDWVEYYEAEPGRLPPRFVQGLDEQRRIVADYDRAIKVIESLRRFTFPEGAVDE